VVLQGHSCALSISGAVSCWGYNQYGQVMLAAAFLMGLLIVAGGDVFVADEVFFSCSSATAARAIATRPWEFLAWAAASP
jgi:hypothetical protein